MKKSCTGYLQYSALWRVIEEKVVPASQELGLGQIVWSPMAEGVLSGKYLPGAEPPAGSRATDEKGGKRMIARWMRDEVHIICLPLFLISTRYSIFLRWAN